MQFGMKTKEQTFGPQHKVCVLVIRVLQLTTRAFFAMGAQPKPTINWLFDLNLKYPVGAFSDLPALWFKSRQITVGERVPHFVNLNNKAYSNVNGLLVCQCVSLFVYPQINLTPLRGWCGDV